jgi:hypothetical protein
MGVFFLLTSICGMAGCILNINIKQRPMRASAITKATFEGRRPSSITSPWAARDAELGDGVFRMRDLSVTPPKPTIL